MLKGTKSVLISGAFAAVAALAMTPGQSWAEGGYASAHVGGSFFGDSNNQGAALSVENTFDTGYVVSGAAGYAFGNGLRLEGELSYRQADIDAFTSVNAGGTTIALGSGLEGDGDVGVLALMANGAYGQTLDNGITPYLTAGIGLARVSVNDAKVVNVALADDNDSVIAFQVGGGASYALTEQVSLDATYRFFMTADPTFSDASGADFDGEISTHNVMVGIRYAF